MRLLHLTPVVAVFAVLAGAVLLSAASLAAAGAPVLTRAAPDDGDVMEEPRSAYGQQSTPAPTASPEPSPGGGGSPARENDDDDQDITLLSLLTLAAIGALAVLGLIGYAVRRRVGFWLHRPPPPGGQVGGPEHH